MAILGMNLSCSGLNPMAAPSPSLCSHNLWCACGRTNGRRFAIECSRLRARNAASAVCNTGIASVRKARVQARGMSAGIPLPATAATDQHPAREVGQAARSQLQARSRMVAVIRMKPACMGTTSLQYALRKVRLCCDSPADCPIRSPCCTNKRGVEFNQCAANNIEVWEVRHTFALLGRSGD